MQTLLHALSIAGAMTWDITWALILGFALSAVVQAVVRKGTVVSLLGDDQPRTLALAAALGAASSSCSYAAVALALADDLGARLRSSDQITVGVTLTVRNADASSTRRSRTLPEATQHTVLLARTAYTLYDSLGLQRARVRGITLRADALRSDDGATRQLTLDSSDDKPLAIEAVADRARARYGHSLLYPAALAVTRGSPTGVDGPGDIGCPARCHYTRHEHSFAGRASRTRPPPAPTPLHPRTQAVDQAKHQSPAGVLAPRNV
ncbi:permease [Streptomyces graminifolii]|uniref:permease n=1 Tax=Streptomyces graminifolii TaxID=1266771 RepID=UPI0040598CA1